MSFKIIRSVMTELIFFKIPRIPLTSVFLVFYGVLMRQKKRGHAKCIVKHASASLHTFFPYLFPHLSLISWSAFWGLVLIEDGGG